MLLKAEYHLYLLRVKSNRRYWYAKIVNREEFMSRFVLVLFALFLFACADSSQTSEMPQIASTGECNDVAWVVDRVLKYQKENDVPAVGIGIVKDGEPLLLRGFGVANRAQNTPFTEDSIIQLGSVTKVLTGIVLNSLIEEGRIDADASIVSYLEEYLTEQAKSRLAEITIEHLLHHRSGLPRDPITQVRADHNSPMLNGYTVENKMKDLNHMELVFQPGTAWSYSNFGYGLLGFIAERETSMSFETLIQRYVALPTGMKITHVNPTDAMTLRIATPYRKDDRHVATSQWDMGKETPSGGIYATTKDMLQLVTAQIAAYQSFAKTNIASPLVITVNTASTELGDPPMRYGYGIFQRQTRYDHFGDLDGYGSDYRFTPEIGLGMIALTNSGGIWLDDMMDEVYETLRQRCILEDASFER